jgi:hypothetical protein
MDCDTVFDGPQCPSRSSESFFPLSRWVRPALAAEAEKLPVRSKARAASAMLVGSGVAFGLWKLFQKPNNKPPQNNNEP